MGEIDLSFRGVSSKISGVLAASFSPYGHDHEVYSGLNSLALMVVDRSVGIITERHIFRAFVAFEQEKQGETE